MGVLHPDFWMPEDPGDHEVVIYDDERDFVLIVSGRPGNPPWHLTNREHIKPENADEDTDKTAA